MNSKTILVIFIFIAVLNNAVFCQIEKIHPILSGIILDADTDLPVSNLTVYTEFTTTTTDELGRYIIPLNNCQCRVGDIIRIMTLNEDYGCSETRYTISSSEKQSHDFKIFSNPNNFFINGIVRDNKNNKPLGGIEVKILLNNSNEKIISTTLSDGTFQIPVSRKTLGSQKTVKMIFTDNKNEYDQNDNLQNITGFVKVELTRNNSFDNKQEIFELDGMELLTKISFGLTQITNDYSTVESQNEHIETLNFLLKSYKEENDIVEYNNTLKDITNAKNNRKVAFKGIEENRNNPTTLKQIKRFYEISDKKNEYQVLSLYDRLILLNEESYSKNYIEISKIQSTIYQLLYASYNSTNKEYLKK